MENGSQQASVAKQVAPMTPDQFKVWIATRQRAVETILQAVTETVKEQQLDTLAGARIAASVTGAVYGYEEFHPRLAGTPGPEQMLDFPELLAGIRGRELAEAH